MRADKDLTLFPLDRRLPAPPRIAMPAMPPLLLIALFQRSWAAWTSRRWIRQQVRQGDKELDTSGLVREDLKWALGLPHEIDAVEALRQKRLGIDTVAIIERARPLSN